MPGTILNSLQGLSHLILLRNLQGWYNYYLRLEEKLNNSPKVDPDSKEQSWDLNPRGSDFNPQPLYSAVEGSSDIFSFLVWQCF